MAEHQHHKPSTSGICADIDLMDIDPIMVIPDTPDRVAKQPNIISKIVQSADSSSRNAGLANRVITGRRNRLFGERIHAAGVYSDPGGNLGDTARSQGASDTAVLSSSSRNAPMSKMVGGGTFRHKDRHLCNQQHMEVDKASHSSFPGLSSHQNRSEDPVLVEHGDIAKSSSVSTRDDFGAQKVNKGYVARSRGASSTVVPSSSCRNAPMLSMETSRNLNYKDRHNCNEQHREDAKVSHTRFSGVSSHHKDSEDPFFVEHGEIAKSSRIRRNDSGSGKMDRGHLLPNNIVSLYSAGASSKSNRNDNKGKVKIGHDNLAHSKAHSVKGNDCLITSDHDTGIGLSVSSHSFRVPSTTVQKRLVHNGCISPHNVAKAKRVAESFGNVFENAECTAVSGGSRPVIDLVDRDTGNGLSVPSHSFRVPSTTVRKRLVRNGCISPHNVAKAKKVAETSGDVSENAECTAESGGSRPEIDVNEVASKQNAAFGAKGKGLLIHDSYSKGHAGRRSDVGTFADGCHKGKSPENDSEFAHNTSGNSNNIRLGKSISSIPSTSSEKTIVVGEGQVCTPNSSINRPKKHGLSSDSPGRSKEVICLSSGGESSTMKSVRNHGGFPHRELGSLLAVDECSPEVRESTSQTDMDSETRAIQLQADEMLARELQEELYNETESTSSERASSLGWIEHQEDSVLPAFLRGSHHVHGSVGAPPSNRLRSSQPQSLRNRLFNRGAHARSRSNLSRLRRRFHHHPTGRNRLFSSNMDLDMRMDLLESLEAVVNDDIRMVNQLLDADREFGEHDYEMLLALDDNNHTHLGASVAHISNLPESTVQNDDSELCSICLETPVIGDTMRHLPCLHKFHKDCIDPWLRRKRSCPVCKSDI